MKSISSALTLVAVLTSSSELTAQVETVFRGIPEIKVSEGGIERRAERLAVEGAGNLASVISRIGERYYWASRENTELVRVQSGAFITFMALNGSGYIRIIASERKELASLMSSTEKQFDYVEHMAIGLRTVTYYGAARTLKQ